MAEVAADGAGGCAPVDVRPGRELSDEDVATLPEAMRAQLARGREALALMTGRPAAEVHARVDARLRALAETLRSFGAPEGAAPNGHRPAAPAPVAGQPPGKSDPTR